MENENLFFSLNHIEHFRRCFCDNIHFESDAMRFGSGKPPQEAMLLSPIFDSCEADTSWHRLTILLEQAEPIHFSFSFFAANTKTVRLSNGTEQDLDVFLQDSTLSAQDKASCIKNADCWSSAYKNAADILLHSFTGRYFCFMLLIKGAVFPTIKKIRVYYPQISFVRYLPDSYQTPPGSFFVRFTALFQSLYLDLDEKIESFYTMLDARTTSQHGLQLLAQWMGLSWFAHIKEDRLRALLLEAAHLYRIWGTKASLERVILLVCGEKPFIQEHFEEEPFAFTVLVRDKIDRKTVTTVIEAIKPAHTRYTLVQLRPQLVLDAHSYLGVNSCLSGYAAVLLDDHTAMTANEI